MRAIWKYEVRTDCFEHEMPMGAKILTVQLQQGKAQLWALVDPMAAKVTRRFATVGTGHSHEDTIDDAAYVGTFQMHGGTLVIHLFDFGETP